MAQFPCEYASHLFRGRAYYIYPAVGRGRDVDRRRFRYCAPHAEKVLLILREDTERQDESGETGYDGQVRCAVCHGAVTSEYRHFWCTAFVDRDGEIVREDYWAPVHELHADQIWNAFSSDVDSSGPFPVRMSLE